MLDKNDFQFSFGKRKIQLYLKKKKILFWGEFSFVAKCNMTFIIIIIIFSTL